MTTEKHLRSLFQCSHAKVKGEDIYCAKKHDLSTNKPGTIHIRQLIRGDPLELRVCQLCADYGWMGPPVPDGQRGWSEEIKPFAIEELGLDPKLQHFLVYRSKIDSLTKLIAVCQGKVKLRSFGTTKIAELKTKLQAGGFEV